MRITIVSKVVAVAAMVFMGGCASFTSEMPAHIVTKISDCRKYEHLNSHFPKAFDFLQRPDITSLPVGRYEIDGSNCWAFVQEAKLVPVEERKIEAHRKFIDIQVPLCEPEIYGLFTMDEEHLAMEFPKNRDVILFKAPVKQVKVMPGECCIFMPPMGGHAPGCRIPGGPDKIRKLVIKVRAD